MGDKSPSAGASGTNGRGKSAPVEPGSNVDLDPADRNRRRYVERKTKAKQAELLAPLWDSTAAGMSAEEMDALAMYKGNSFKFMNKYLREPEGFDAMLSERFSYDTPENIANFKQTQIARVQALRNAPTVELGKDTVLYRGLDFYGTDNSLGRMFSEGAQNGTLIGAQFTDKGFGSTTLSADFVKFSGVQLRIRAPKETKVWVPDTNGPSKEEQEVVLKNNTTYTVRGYEVVNDRLVVDVDI